MPPGLAAANPAEPSRRSAAGGAASIRRGSRGPAALHSRAPARRSPSRPSLGSCCSSLLRHSSIRIPPTTPDRTGVNTGRHPRDHTCCNLTTYASRCPPCAAFPRKVQPLQAARSSAGTPLDDEMCTTRPPGGAGPSRCPMPASPALRRVGWMAIAELQGGIISRGQLLDLDLTSAQAKSDISTGRWRPMLPGVYATFTGPIGAQSRVWAAILYAGRGAAASHGTALWLWKLADEAPAVIDVVVPESRRVQRQPGLRVHRRRALNSSNALIHPSARPARLRVEEAVLDHCDAVAAPAAAIDLVLRATQRRVTTADRLRRSMHQRPRQRWRSLLLDVLAEVQVGVASNLELAYRRDVEQRHLLPAGTRNEMEDGRRGGHLYRDVRYRTWHLIVELDGREAHPVGEAFRDMRRDNVAAVAGDTSLRYGWRDVVGDPCGVAAQVSAVLQLGGWTGSPRRCSVACTVDRLA